MSEGRKNVYLKSLELQGFKSFPDKTKLTFEGGTTVIVGPNGSGKSNISDAMRWVLGEVSTKNIRGSKMEDIIFGGADTRRPMGYAEVSVTFDNTDPLVRLDCPYDEVTVTRRYYRAGESEYFINRRAVRLRDIYELFMNTGVGRDGYSIIGQGRIAEIIAKKSDDRRDIFEDASGIAKYRHKKSETERKLASTEDNMTRISDIFAEVEAQVGPLEKEAQKARRALELIDVKKQVDVQLWLYDTEKLRADIGRAEELYRHSQFDLSSAEDSIRAFEVQNERLFEAAQSNKQTSEGLLAEIRRETDVIHALDSEYRVNETNILHTQEMLAAAESASAAARKSISEEEEIQRAQEEKNKALYEKLLAQKAEHEAAAELCRKEDAEEKKIEFEIAKALDDIHALESEDVDIKARVSVIEKARLSDTDKHTAMLLQISEYEKISAEMGAQADSARRAATGYEKAIAECEADIEKQMSELADMYSQRHEANEALIDKKLSRDSVAQRVETFRAMEEQLEGYSGSVRFVMKKYSEGEITDKKGNKCGKIYGPISKLISVEDKYVIAVETALAANLQHIVVEDESVAKAAMFALKRADAGRATFFPLTSVSGQSVTPEMRDAAGFDGYIGIADELLSCDSKFDEVMSSILGRTVVFDTIDHATEMAKSLKYKVKAVTLDGQQINVGGSYTGGSVKKNGNILGRASEIKKLDEELKRLSEQIVKEQKELDALAKEIEARESDREEAESKKKLLGVLLGSENTKLEQLTAKIDANNTLTSRLRADYDNMLEAYSKYDEDIKSFSERSAEIAKQIEEIAAVRAKKDVERHAAHERRESAEKKMTELYIGISETQKDIETGNAMLMQSDARIEKFCEETEKQNGRIGELNEKLSAIAEAQNQNRESYAAGEARLAELGAKRAEVEEGSNEFEKKLADVNAKMREKMAQKEVIFREHTKCENRLENLRIEQDKLATKLWDDYELTRADAVALGYEPITAETRAGVAAKQTEYRNKLRAIGNVDLDAVNKYKEVKERYDYMKSQLDDLDASKKDLLDIIQKLEIEMKDAFVDSFNLINENFNAVFSELFGGGSAELILTDPDNVLESGIEIKAAPPGKIIKNMVQLSGGEQAFIAIALFFAIIKVNPTPFCILDEIEAALDEVNVARFAEYIKRYSDATQFVLITHRRGTMEAANRLYGVTMPQRGISKVLELNIDEIQKSKGDDLDGIFG